jgi:hypothetical protein
MMRNEVERVCYSIHVGSSVLQIEVKPSLDSNDHQVRFLVDGEEIIRSWWDDMLGLDPDDILVSPSPLRRDGRHTATIARCSCGVVGCGSNEVEIYPDDDAVVWRGVGEPLRFGASDYLAELERAEQDTSWESADRTVARLVRLSVDRDHLVRHGLSFGWTSGRVRPNEFTVSLNLEPGFRQVLVSIPWTSQTPGQLASEITTLLRQLPSEWRSVMCQAQGLDHSLTAIAGPGWRLGSDLTGRWTRYDAHDDRRAAAVPPRHVRVQCHRVSSRFLQI